MKVCMKHLKRLITMAQGVIEAQVIHFWYENLETKFKQRMWDVTLLQINQPTLAYVFLLTKMIELNMVGKKMVTFYFQGQTTHPWSFQPQTQHGQLNKNVLQKFEGPLKGNQVPLASLLGQ